MARSWEMPTKISATLEAITKSRNFMLHSTIQRIIAQDLLAQSMSISSQAVTVEMKGGQCLTSNHQTFQPAPHLPVHPRLHAHCLQVRCYEIRDLVQIFQIMAIATGHVGDLTAPYALICFFGVIFNPDSDDERLGIGPSVIHCRSRLSVDPDLRSP